MADALSSHGKLSHGMNCAAYARPQSGDCTCGLQWRIALDTERTMHAAWRKRAEEAEAELRALKQPRETPARLVLKAEEYRGFIRAAELLEAYGPEAVWQLADQHRTELERLPPSPSEQTGEQHGA